MSRHSYTEAQLVALIHQAAERHGVDPAIFERQIRLESMNLHPDVIAGQRDSSAGARGIAQLMPVHWKAVDPTDVRAALDYAARLMASHLRTYDGDYRLALAAYNAGPGNVQKYGGVPPFEETQHYIHRILGERTPTQAQTRAGTSGRTPGFASPTTTTQETQMASQNTAPVDPRSLGLDPDAYVGSGPVSYTEEKDAQGRPIQEQKWVRADGRVEIWRWNYDTQQWSMYDNTRIDKDRAATWDQQVRAARAEAEQKAKSEQPRVINTNTTDRYIVTMNPDGTTRREPNPNYTPPGSEPSRTVEVPNNRRDPRDPSTRTVSVDQFQAERQIAQDERARQNDEWARMQAEADRQWRESRARIEDAFAERRIGLQEAQLQAQREYQRIQANLQHQQNLLTQRGQEVTMRGQDLQTQTAIRGQNMDFASELGRTGVNASLQALPFVAPKGTAEDLAALGNAFRTGQLPDLQPRSVPFPFDPAQLGVQIANQALAQLSPAAAAATGATPNGTTFTPVARPAEVPLNLPQ